MTEGLKKFTTPLKPEKGQWYFDMPPITHEHFWGGLDLVRIDTEESDCTRLTLSLCMFDRTKYGRNPIKSHEWRFKTIKPDAEPTFLEVRMEWDGPHLKIKKWGAVKPSDRKLAKKALCDYFGIVGGDK